MIKTENKMVIIQAEDRVEMMNDFINIIKAVHATVKQTESEDQATKIVLGAASYALEKEIDQMEDEVDEVPETPEEPQMEEYEDCIIKIEARSPEELMELLNSIAKVEKKEGEK